MKPDFVQKYYPLTLDQLNIFESKIGYNLPQSYREFLLEQNGGMIEIDKYNYSKNQIDLDVELYHKVIFEDGDIIYHTLLNFTSIDIENPPIINQNDENTQEIYELELYGDYGIHLDIGDGLDYSTTTMSLNKYDYGSIYRFDNHANYGKENHKNCAKVSNSFEEFYNSFEFYKI